MGQTFYQISQTRNGSRDHIQSAVLTNKLGYLESQPEASIFNFNTKKLPTMVTSLHWSRKVHREYLGLGFLGTLRYLQFVIAFVDQCWQELTALHPSQEYQNVKSDLRTTLLLFKRTHVNSFQSDHSYQLPI